MALRTITPRIMRFPCAIAALLLPLAISSAQSRPTPMPRDPIRGLLPSVPAVRGPLQLRVVHPQPGALIEAQDSTFVFGSAGSGDAEVRVDGRPVRVAPNGAWLAWVPLPPEATFALTVEARRGIDSTRLVLPMRRDRAFVVPTARVWIDTTSFEPRGRLWRMAGAEVALRVRAAPGARLTLRFADGTRVPLVPSGEAASRADGVLAFDGDTARRRTVVAADRYAGRVVARAVGAHPGELLELAPPTSAAGNVRLEAVIGSDTARALWPLQMALLDSLPQVVRLDDDPRATGTTDSMTVGRAVRGGSYHWFLHTGTRALLVGRQEDDALLQLSAGQEVWVPMSDVQPLPRGLPRPRAVIGSPALKPGARSLVLRVPWTMPVPVQVVESAGGLRLLFHAAEGDIDWIRYGGTDPLVARVHWQQLQTDLLAVDIELNEPLWGWRTRVTDGDFVLEVRRPPRIDRVRPLAGRTIVVDPGHPPLGATGPTGLREAEANLGVALLLAPMLRRAGAKVLLTRTTDTTVALADRVPFAERADADLLLSIHNNALPDGVEPFANSGTSVFYNRMAGLDLAMRVQESLSASLGVRALGVAQGDLALVRGTWVPSILTEGLFMMIPEHEAALRTRAGQLRYARGVFDGVQRFLRRTALRSGQRE